MKSPLNRQRGASPLKLAVTPSVQTRHVMRGLIMESTLECPKCGQALMEGFIADFTHSREQSTTMTWFEGASEPSLLRGIKLKGKQNYSVRACRCRNCGYIELYA